MPDEQAPAPAPTPAPPAARPAPPPKPLEPGEFVVFKGGHPNRGDLADEPVGRIVAIEPVVKVVLDRDGKPALDAAGAVKTEPDGERLAVTWPKLRIESKHRADELEAVKP